MSALDAELAAWLDASADGLDTGTQQVTSLLPTLAGAGLARIGVPQALGGTGGDVTDAVESIAAVSERSLAAGFVLWGHRTYIEYLLQSPNAALRERLLPDLLDGRLAGATALSNAMKFLSGLEELQITASPIEGGYRLAGKMPWVTNLRVEGFHVAAAVSRQGGGNFIASLPSDGDGLVRSADLDLMALRSTSTAAIDVRDVALSSGDVLHEDADKFLPAVRPAFLSLQIGMSIGLARRSLAEALAATGAGRNVLHDPIAALTRRLKQQEQTLLQGLRNNTFQVAAASLFQLRIDLAEIAAEAVALELQASGGRAYLTVPGRGFARRWREAAFLPVITPSLVQLKTVLAQQQKSAA